MMRTSNVKDVQASTTVLTNYCIELAQRFFFSSWIKHSRSNLQTSESNSLHKVFALPVSSVRYQYDPPHH